MLRGTAEKSAGEVPVDSPQNSKPLKEQIKQMLDAEKDSTSKEENTFPNFSPKPSVRNGFRRKKGDSPLVYNLNLKIKKEKKQSNYTNPDPWARIVGSRNTAAIYIDGIATTTLYDSGAEIQLISKEFCEENNLKIHPIEKLTECSTMNGDIFGYEGFVEVNVQIPGRDFSEDHLFLVTSEISHQKEIPVVVGTYFISSLSEYLKTFEKEAFDELDLAIQQAYYSWEEAAKIREKYGCKPPLGVVKTTKPVTIYAGERKEIHGITKIKQGGYSVNCISEPAMEKALPKGLKLITGYSPLGAGSSRVYNVIVNISDQDITIPAKTIVCQLSLANMIPKLIYSGDDYDNEMENIDEKDEGLTYQEFEHHKSIPNNSEQNFNKVEIEDLGEDLEEDFVDLDQRNSIPQDSEKGNSSEPNSENSEEEDDGSWILNLIDLSGLENWPEHLQIEAKEMLKRNAKASSKNDLDMGRTNLVKHHIKLTDPIPFKEAYRRIPPQMYEEVKAHIQEMLDLGPSNSPRASAIVLVRKKDGRLRFCIDLRRLNNRTAKDAYSLPKIESILDSLLGAKIFSTLDLKGGYWQVEMAEECKACTTFTCGPLGFYECDTMPFGATNAQATFQRLMHDCLGDLNMRWCIMYLDDIIIFSDTKQEHLKRLEAVFQKLAAAGLKLKPSKCFFFRGEIEYLEHVVSGKGISTNP